MKFISFGNCQINQIFNAFERQHKFFDGYGHQLLFIDANLPDALTKLNYHLPECDRLVWQGRGQFRDPPSFRGDVIRIPTIYFTAFWPFDGEDANIDSRIFEGAPVVRGDTNIVRLRNMGLGLDQIFKAYCEMDVASHVDLDGLIERELETQHRKDANCDIALAPYIEANIWESRLFAMAWHPTNRLLRFVQDQPILWDFFGMNRTQAQQTLRYWNGPERLEPEVPIHPSIIAHFGVRWAPSKYNHYGTMRRFEDWLRAYLEMSEGIVAQRPASGRGLGSALYSLLSGVTKSSVQ